MEPMKEGGVYTLVQQLDQEAVIAIAAGPTDHVTKAKMEARAAVPAAVAPSFGRVNAVIVRVEAVIPFVPALVPVEEPRQRKLPEVAKEPEVAEPTEPEGGAS